MKNKLLNALVFSLSLVLKPALANDITANFAFFTNMSTTSVDANEGFFILPAEGTSAFDEGVINFRNNNNDVIMHSSTPMHFRVTKTYSSNATPIDYYYKLQNFEVFRNGVFDQDLNDNLKLKVGGSDMAVGDIARRALGQLSMPVELYLDDKSVVSDYVENDTVNVNATLLVTALVYI